MHRKRVTSKLHDSYFRLMTIKHAIPKIEWAIEWAIELFYNSVRQQVSELESDELETRCSRESHHPAEVALGTPDGVWGPDQLERRCWNENKSQRGWAPGPPVEHQENEKDTTLMVRRVGVNILQFCSVSNSLSHANLTIK